jgi:hypothetical protein
VQVQTRRFGSLETVDVVDVVDSQIYEFISRLGGF